jgi:hypothetical protein
VTPETLARRYMAGPLVSFHEAGHCLIAHRLGRQVERVHVGFARDQGATRFVSEIYNPEHRALVLLAGERAERRSFSWLPDFERLDGSREDREGLAWAMKELPGVTEAELIERVDDVLLWDSLALERLARRLDDVRVLTGAEVAELLGG